MMGPSYMDCVTIKTAKCACAPTAQSPTSQSLTQYSLLTCSRPAGRALWASHRRGPIAGPRSFKMQRAAHGPVEVEAYPRS